MTLKLKSRITLNDVPVDGNSWLHNLKSAKVAVVVAHPDDESLWAGGLLSWWKDHGEEPITVYCCSIPETEPERAMKFFDACEHFKAKPKLNPFVEVRGGHLSQLIMIDLSRYDVIFTHNEKGEYGHKHHIDVYNYVTKVFRKTIYTFGYGMEGGEELTFDWLSKFVGIRYYDHQSALMNIPKWHELIDRWSEKFDLKTERYIREK